MLFSRKLGVAMLTVLVVVTHMHIADRAKCPAITDGLTEEADHIVHDNQALTYRTALGFISSVFGRGDRSGGKFYAHCRI